MGLRVISAFQTREARGRMLPPSDSLSNPLRRIDLPRQLSANAFGQTGRAFPVESVAGGKQPSHASVEAP
jgi:hypothetical protein